MVTSKIIPYIFTLLIITVLYGGSAFNITEILDSDPTLSDFNSYLTRTKLADEINSRKTITVLAVSNSVMSSVYGNSTAAIKNVLSLHILLDFYDDIKLHNLKFGTNTTATTLYQTTGDAQDNTGQVNITNNKHGEVTFSSAQAGSRPGPKLLKEISHLGFNLSVLEVSDLIIVRSLLTSGPPDVNITAAAESGGCRTFAAMITTSGVVKTYMKQASSEGGITVFAPKDAAFKKKDAPDLSNVSDAELVSLLLFHALNSYAPITTLKSSKSGLKTLAPPQGHYGISATTDGGVVTLHTGVDTSEIITTLKDEFPVVVYAIDTILLPEELFGTPAEAPAPEAEPPTPKRRRKAHSPAKSPDASPPAPPADEGGSDGGFDDGPTAADDDDDDKEGKNGGEVSRNVSLVLTVVVLVFSVSVMVVA